jgi:hypothetical protein
VELQELLLEKAIVLVISTPKICYRSQERAWGRAEPTPVQKRAKSLKGGGGGEQDKMKRHKLKIKVLRKEKRGPQNQTAEQSKRRGGEYVEMPLLINTVVS